MCLPKTRSSNLQNLDDLFQSLQNLQNLDDFNHYKATKAWLTLSDSLTHHLSGLSSPRQVLALLSVRCSFPPLPWPLSCNLFRHLSLPFCQGPQSTYLDRAAILILRCCLKLKRKIVLRKRSSMPYLCLLRTNRTNWLFITCEESNARQDTDLSLVSFLPQGVLDLVLDSLWYGSLVGGMV